MRLMLSGGIFCLCALVVLIVLATCSAIKFPRRPLSQALFESLGVLFVAFVLVLGTITSTPPEEFLRRTHKSLTTNSDPQRSPTPGTWKSMQSDDPTLPERLYRQMVHPELADPENPFGGN
jgi:hypothetical protein